MKERGDERGVVQTGGGGDCVYEGAGGGPGSAGRGRGRKVGGGETEDEGGVGCWEGGGGVDEGVEEDGVGCAVCMPSERASDQS